MTIRRRRLLLLLLGLPLYVFALMLLGVLALAALMDEWPSRAELLELLGEADFWLWFGAPAAAVTAIQWVFLIPVMHGAPPRGERSRPLTISLLIGATIAAGLCLGLGCAVVSFLHFVVGIDQGTTPWVWAVPLVMLGASWAIWSGLLLLFVRDIWADRVLGRLVAVLFAGTLLETLAVLPLDLMVRRRTDCYCQEGTFFALGLSAGAGLVLAGPGIVILVISRKHRRWRRRYCGRCGYPRGPSPGPACPECGHEWGTGPKPRPAE